MEIPINGPIRDLKVAHFIAQQIMRLAQIGAHQAGKKVPEGFKLEATLQWDAQKLAFTHVKITASPIEAHNVLIAGYLALEGDHEDVRAVLARALPVVCAPPS
jgi:hypothetical protein